MKLLTIARVGLIAILSISGASLRAQTSSTWSGAGLDGNWGDNSNWTGGAYPGITGTAGMSATFYNAGYAAAFKTVSSNNTVNLDANNYGINSLLFYGASGSYTIGGLSGNPLNFAGSALATGNMYIAVGNSGTIDSIVTSALTSTSQVTITIAAPVTVNTASNFELLNNSASGTGTGSALLNVTGNISNGTTGNSPTVILGGSSTNVNTISGSINENGAYNNHMGVTLNASADTWNLTSTASTFGGALTINAGIVEVASVANAGTASSIGKANPYVMSPAATIILGQNGLAAGTLDLIGTLSTYGTNRNIQLASTSANGGVGNIEVANAGTTLSLSGTILAGSSTYNANLTLEGPGSGVVSGGIGGSGGIGTTNAMTLNINSGGTWTISGSNANLLGKGVNVNTGTLLVGSGATLNAGATNGVVVASGATLQGTGTLTGAGGVFDDSGAIMHVGADNTTTGTTLTVTSGALTTYANSNLTFVLGTGFAHTTLALDSTQANSLGSMLSFTLDGTVAAGNYTNIITGLAADPANEGTWTITNAGDVGTFLYSGGNITLDVTAIPEPSSLAMMFGGIAALVFLRRRQRERI